MTQYNSMLIIDGANIFQIKYRSAKNILRRYRDSKEIITKLKGGSTRIQLKGQMMDEIQNRISLNQSLTLNHIKNQLEENHDNLIIPKRLSEDLKKGASNYIKKSHV